MKELLIVGWCVAVLLGCLVAWYRLHQLLKLFHVRQLLSTPSMLGALPSVSVCIPARNERHAMTRCLESVLASTYPKLEVLVLDDASIDNTSQLIKAFAKDGVRFIAGGDPPSGWLGKNYALKTLFAEANGTYVLFLDVDTVLAPSSIAQLVAYAETTEAEMISILPQRSDMWRMSVALAPLRYFWHVLGHRPARPVAASNAWMVRRRSFLQDFGSFAALASDVEPEVAAARHYAAHDTYRFLTSHQLLGVFYEKKLSSQIETTVRLRYPQLGYSAWRSLLASVAKLLVALTPLAWLFTQAAVWPSIAVYVVGALCYRAYLMFVWERGAWLGMWLWPLVLAGDAWLTLVSLVRYRTNSVTWKGRPISPPRQSEL